ncbi:uncharacterized metal-dependent hydrolase YabD-like [Littorina saxatilis]|uniref:uncharacterized metal-dependent hydrolase YabD-like n=1 Tax=Littorina saxatilis TaxID=31220 RepID=UPI0038B6422F
MIHHFIGPVEEITKWLDAFPHTMFSVGGVTTLSPADQVAAIKAVPVGHLLLETDAPYFGLAGAPGTPYDVFGTAEVVANWREVDQREILRVTVENARRFFRLAR